MTEIDPLTGLPVEEDPSGEANTGDEVTIADLQKQIADLTQSKETTEQQLQRLERTNVQLLTGQPAQKPAEAAPQAPELAKLDLTGLPDPVEHPNEYSQQLGDRVNAVISTNTSLLANQKQTVDTSAQQREGRIADLWTEFSERHQDLAAHEDIVKAAAANAIAKAQRSGLDSDTYIFRLGEQFIEDTAAETRRIISSVTPKPDAEQAAAGEGEDSKPVFPSPVPATGEEDANRTAGVMAATPPKTPAKKGAKDEGEGNMIKEMTDMQLKTGFF